MHMKVRKEGKYQPGGLVDKLEKKARILETDTGCDLLLKVILRIVSMKDLRRFLARCHTRVAQAFARANMLGLR